MFTGAGNPFLVYHIGAFFSFDLGEVNIVELAFFLQQDMGQVPVNIRRQAFVAQGTVKFNPFAHLNVEIGILVGGVIAYFIMEQDQALFFPFVFGHENDILSHP
jgi:hypothetical protein